MPCRVELYSIRGGVLLLVKGLALRLEWCKREQSNVEESQA